MAMDYFIACADCKEFIFLHNWRLLHEARHGLDLPEPSKEMLRVSRSDALAGEAVLIPSVAWMPILPLNPTDAQKAIADALLTKKHPHDLLNATRDFIAKHSGHYPFLGCAEHRVPWNDEQRAWWQWKEARTRAEDKLYLPRNWIEDLGLRDWESVLAHLRRAGDFRADKPHALEMERKGFQHALDGTPRFDSVEEEMTQARAAYEQAGRAFSDLLLRLFPTMPDPRPFLEETWKSVQSEYAAAVRTGRQGAIAQHPRLHDWIACLGYAAHQCRQATHSALNALYHSIGVAGDVLFVRAGTGALAPLLAAIDAEMGSPRRLLDRFALSRDYKWQSVPTAALLTLIRSRHVEVGVLGPSWSNRDLAKLSWGVLRYMGSNPLTSGKIGVAALCEENADSSFALMHVDETTAPGGLRGVLKRLGLEDSFGAGMRYLTTLPRHVFVRDIVGEGTVSLYDPELMKAFREGRAAGLTPQEIMRKAPFASLITEATEAVMQATKPKRSSFLKKTLAALVGLFVKRRTH